MAEYEDKIRFKIKIDSAEAQQEARKAVELERGKRARSRGVPLSSPAVGGAPPDYGSIAAEQEREKLRVQRLVGAGPALQSRIVAGATGGTQVSFGGATAARIAAATPRPPRQRRQPPQPATPRQPAQAAAPRPPALRGINRPLPLPPLPPSQMMRTLRMLRPLVPHEFRHLMPGGGSASFGGLSPVAAGAVGAAVAMSVRNLIAGIQRMNGGLSQISAGAKFGNGSQIIKGYASTIGGGAQIAGGPILGYVIGKVTDKFNALVDATDRLAATFARYNGQIAASQARLRISEIQANIRSANAMAPTLSGWNELKSHLIDINSKIDATNSGIEARIFAPFLSAGNKLLVAVDKLLNWLGYGDKGKPGFGGQAVADRFNAWGKSIPGGNARAMTGGILPNIAGTVAHRGQIDRDRQTNAEDLKFYQKTLVDLRRSGADSKTIRNYEDRIKELQARQRGGSAPGIGIPRPPTSAGLISKNPRGESSDNPAESPPQSRVQANAPTPPVAPLAQIDIQQNIQLKMEMNLQHKKEIWESIMQIRDELLRGSREATNEARLAMSMLNLGGITGTI